MTSTFDGKVVLVTGAAAGIGRASAHAFARAGAMVVVADVDETGAKETVELIGGDSVARYIRADVSDHDDAGRMVDTALSAFGRLDIAHNNAGIEIALKPLADIDPADWDRVLNVNLTGVFACMRAQIPAILRSGGGAIVNTASALGTVAIANQAAYVASKHGLIGLTKAAALEYSSAGIRINAVCPGAVRTAMVEKLAEENVDFMPLMIQTHPIGRLATPDEIADVVTWLSSPAASFITGQAIHADGGYTTQ
jgi:NAD(P)-dependent dehydrogenase (short-subunit alcohol dehydrogenase family)